MTVHVYIMYGAGGRAFSAGMEDKLAPLLRQMVGVDVPRTIDYTHWRDWVAAINLMPATDRVVVAGHSLGAAMATHVALAVAPRPVDLLVGYDCTLWNRVTVGFNVKRVLEFKGHTWVNPFGARLLRPWTPAGQPPTPYNVYSRTDAHVAFDDDMGLHRIFATAVRELVAGQPSR